MDTEIMIAEAIPAKLKIRFLTHYRSRLVDEDFYTPGQVAELDTSLAELLIEQGLAAAADPDAPVNEPTEAGALRRSRALQERQKAQAAMPPVPVPEAEPLYAGLDGVRVRFAHAHRSKHTLENYYLAGAVTMLSPEAAQKLQAYGIVTLAEADARISPPAERRPSGQARIPEAPRADPEAEARAALMEIPALLRRVIALLEEGSKR